MTDTPVLWLTPPPFAEDQALAAIWDALPQARVVGGAVRDAIAGRPIADIDLASPLPPDAAMAALSEVGIRVVPTGLAHGTITAIRDGRGFEITTLRHDVETDGRHAVVAFTSDWRADALRRDFTINALSLARDGGVFDYFNGVADLHAGRVRFVGNASERIQEDFLRILRFFRFHARYGLTAPDPDTLVALRAGVRGLDRLSIERIWTELSRILAAPDPVAAFSLMEDLGILAAVAPELSLLGQGPEQWASRRLAALQATGAPPDPILRLAAMLPGGATRSFAARMKLANQERDRLERLKTAPAPSARDDDAALRRLLANVSRTDLIDRTWLAADPAQPELRRRLAALAVPVFPLEGRDVLARGVSPGPRVGTLLRDVRQWWLAGGCVADFPACAAELARRTCEVD